MASRVVAKRVHDLDIDQVADPLIRSLGPDAGASKAAAGGPLYCRDQS